MALNYRFLKCEPKRVFDVLADGWLYPTWVVGASRMRAVDGDWPNVGSAIHHSVGVWPLILNDSTEMLEWDPTRHALLKARGWPAGEMHVTIDVRRRGDGCVVRLREEPVAGPLRFVPHALTDAAIHSRNDETLHRLAYLAEGGAGAGSKNAYTDGSAV